MAWVDKPYEISYTIEDDDGAKSVHTIYCSRLNIIGNVETFAASYRTKLQALISSTITRMSISLPAYDNAPTFTAGSDVETKGVFSFLNSAGTYTTITVPGVKETILASNKKDINTDNAAVADWITGLTGDGWGASVDPLESRGADLVRVAKAYKQQRLSHKSRGERKG